jgi:glycosyltransferase involved in cell wall biosynthesis
MSCGLATVAARTGGTPEIVGESGFLFEREAVDELADHLFGLINDPESRRDYAMRARNRAMQLTWDKTWSALRNMVNIDIRRDALVDLKVNGIAAPTGIR